jgi:transposase
VDSPGAGCRSLSVDPAGGASGRQGRPFRYDRRFVAGINCRYRCGIAWRDIPAEFGPWQFRFKSRSGRRRCHW